MNQLVEFFEAILRIVVTYPATIVYVLFSPNTLLDKERNNSVCPASYTLVISVFLYMRVGQLWDEILSPGTLMKEGFPTFITLGMLVVFESATVVVRAILRRVFGLKTNTNDPLEELRLLSYPLSTGLVVSSIATVLTIDFPNITIWLASLTLSWDSQDPESVRFLSSETLVTRSLVCLCTAWAFSNVIRVCFHATFRRSLLAAVTSLLVVVALSQAVYAWTSRTSSMVERLSVKSPAAQLTEAFNNHSPAAVGRLYSADQVTLLPGIAQPVAGRVAKEQMLAAYYRAFPDLKLDIPLVLCSGDHIVCEGTLTGTNTGLLESPEGQVPPTGRSITLPLAFILKVGSDGLITEDRTYFDEASFLRQLGLLR